MQSNSEHQNRDAHEHVQPDEDHTGDDEPVRPATALPREPRDALLPLEFAGCQTERDVDPFIGVDGGASGDLLQTRGRNLDTDASELPTHPSGISAGQRWTPTGVQRV